MPLLTDLDPARNWPDDKRYMGNCHVCKQVFCGPKRAPSCYQCHLENRALMEDVPFVSPCPPPTPYERELLTILIEECMEVAQRATKMLRFGVEEVQPGQDLSNRDRLSDEVGDLQCMIQRCMEENLVDGFRARDARTAKKHKLAKYMQTTEEKKE